MLLSSTSTVIINQREIMQENKPNIPDFNFGPDFVLAKLSLIVFLTPLMYGAFFGYMPKFLHIPMIPGFFVITTALYFLGRLLTKAVMKERIEYDPEKTLRDYVRIRKTWLTFLGALAIGVIFFFIALAVKNWYWAVFDDKTQGHSKGYMYEIFCGAYAFFVTYFSGVVWFFHDGTFMPAENYLTFGIAAPLSVYLIMPMFAGVPKRAATVYTAVLIVLFLIRHFRIRSYDKMVAKLEKNHKNSGYRSKYDE